jgi:hypothetical protein
LNIIAVPAESFLDYIRNTLFIVDNQNAAHFLPPLLMLFNPDINKSALSY